MRTPTPVSSYICLLFHPGNYRNRSDSGPEDLFNNNTGVQFRVIASDGVGGTQWSTSSSVISYTGGNVGIGTSDPKVALDISGSLRMDKYSSEPFVCEAVKDGAIALTSLYTTCVCKNGSGWVSTSDGSIACIWN